MSSILLSIAKYIAQDYNSNYGIKTLNVTAKTGPVVGAYVIDAASEKDLVVISDKGQTLRTKLSSIPALGRATQGVRVMRLQAGDKIAGGSLV